jgi:N-formylglutamate deformylase
MGSQQVLKPLDSPENAVNIVTMKDVLAIHPPKSSALPLVFDSPHSGYIYPADFEYGCDFKILESAEDKFVDDLFATATDCGATLLCAHFPRSYIDVNRRYDDIEPELLGDEEWSGPFEAIASPRAHAGIGLIRRLVRPGVPVYKRALTSAEILSRIERFYHPYHETLEELLTRAHYNFGQVWHINCHSMPEASAYPRSALSLAGSKPRPSDFVLGDRDGTSCSVEFTRALREFLKKQGYVVTINDPFKGVELIEKYSDPARGLHSLQIEINKSLYMNEITGEKTKGYSKIKSDLAAMNRFIADFVSSRLVNLAAD